MSNAIKALLLSGLGAPGVGHLMLRHYVRGVLLLTVVLGGLGVIMVRLMQAAMTLQQRLLAGTAELEVASLHHGLLLSLDPTNNRLLLITYIVLITAWACGMVDAYRLGRIKDNA